MKSALFLSILIKTSIASDWGCADYYWRDSRGFIPEDAVIGGVDNQERPVYIGKAYIPGREFLTAEIYRKEFVTAAVISGIYQLNYTDLTTSILILCSPHPHAFEWYPITAAELPAYDNNYNLIPGGFEISAELKIGKYQINGADYIGKAFAQGPTVAAQNSGLWYPYNGRRVQTLQYQVLAFNCSRLVA